MTIELVPFVPTPMNLQLKVDTTYLKGRLFLTYKLDGELEKISTLDDDLCAPKRQHELWQNTCFEWFLKSKNHSRYWEFNASPNGGWNFYVLEGYRNQLTEFSLNSPPQIQSKKLMENLKIKKYQYEVDFPLGELIETQKLFFGNLQLNITAVIKWKNSEVSYFSTKHPDEKPDFHHSIGFSINLEDLLND